MNIIAYIRVSTKEQELGLDVQRLACEEYAKTLIYDNFMMFKDDGISGALPYQKRPGLRNAMESIKKNDILLIYRRDRLGRNVYDILSIEKELDNRKARLVSISGEGNGNTEADEFTRLILAGAAQYERKIIARRIKDAMHEKKNRMERIGRIPYGYKLDQDNVHLIIDVEEVKVLDEIALLKKSGTSLRECMRILNAKGVYNRTGPWTLSSIHRIASRKEVVPKQNYVLK